MGRKILFITTDQQRYDSLGCNGGRIARTPVADSLAAAGITALTIRTLSACPRVRP
jgi:arylsulfatase A-like enzyme